MALFLNKLPESINYGIDAFLTDPRNKLHTDSSRYDGKVNIPDRQ